MRGGEHAAGEVGRNAPAPAPAPEYDPTIEQTRWMARRLFASELASHRGVRRDPLAARLAWIASSSQRGDGGLVNILHRLDPETFAATWHELVSTLEALGARAMLERLESERGS